MPNLVSLQTAAAWYRSLVVVRLLCCGGEIRQYQSDVGYKTNIESS
jgi:hypothetical protein